MPDSSTCSMSLPFLYRNASVKKIITATYPNAPTASLSSFSESMAWIVSGFTVAVFRGCLSFWTAGEKTKNEAVLLGLISFNCCSPSLFMPIWRHFFNLQAWHWFRWALSMTQLPVPAWHLQMNKKYSLLYRFHHDWGKICPCRLRAKHWIWQGCLQKPCELRSFNLNVSLLDFI